MRINKYLASCGVASRRNCEEYILQGRVKINGRRVKDLSILVRPDDIVTLDGKKVQPQKHIYLMLHKPKGYLSTTKDDRGRKTVMELVKAYRDTRLFPVGRLDYDTEGLLLLTTDGEFAQKLTHPSNQVPKTYHVKVEGEVYPIELEKLQNGVVLDGVRTKKCKATLISFLDNISKIEITITEGRNRQIRRMFEAIGRNVLFLKRVAIGQVRLGGLTRGKYRPLKEKEINQLKNG